MQRYYKIVLLRNADVFLNLLFSYFKNSPTASDYSGTPRESFDRIKKEAELFIKQNNGLKEKFTVFYKEHRDSKKDFSPNDFRLIKSAGSKQKDNAVLYDIAGDFENFLAHMHHAVSNTEPSFLDLKTERQASPPKEVYEMVGHVADTNIKKMSYSYLYDE